MSGEIDAAMDAAQQMTTAVLHGDRETAAKIAADYIAQAPETATAEAGQLLACVCADFAAHIHRSWGRATGIDPEPLLESWTHLCEDLEAWRAQNPRTP